MRERSAVSLRGTRGGFRSGQNVCADPGKGPAVRRQPPSRRAPRMMEWVWASRLVQRVPRARRGTPEARSGVSRGCRGGRGRWVAKPAGGARPPHAAAPRCPRLGSLCPGCCGALPLSAQVVVVAKDAFGPGFCFMAPFNFFQDLVFLLLHSSPSKKGLRALKVVRSPFVIVRRLGPTLTARRWGALSLYRGRACRSRCGEGKPGRARRSYWSPTPASRAHTKGFSILPGCTAQFAVTAYANQVSEAHQANLVFSPWKKRVSTCCCLPNFSSAQTTKTVY